MVVPGYWSVWTRGRFLNFHDDQRWPIVEENPRSDDKLSRLGLKIVRGQEKRERKDKVLLSVIMGRLFEWILRLGLSSWNLVNSRFEHSSQMFLKDGVVDTLRYIVSTDCIQ